MKYLGSVRGIRGKWAKPDCGSWPRRLTAMTYNRSYRIVRPNIDAIHVQDFIWISEYNAWLRSYEQLRSVP